MSAIEEFEKLLQVLDIPVIRAIEARDPRSSDTLVGGPDDEETIATLVESVRTSIRSLELDRASIRKELGELVVSWKERAEKAERELRDATIDVAKERSLSETYLNQKRTIESDLTRVSAGWREVNVRLDRYEDDVESLRAIRDALREERDVLKRDRDAIAKERNEIDNLLIEKTSEASELRTSHAISEAKAMRYFEVARKIESERDERAKVARDLYEEVERLRVCVIDLRVLLDHEILRASAFLDRRPPPSETNVILDARMRDGARSK